MIKKNLWKFILSSLAILAGIPILALIEKNADAGLPSALAGYATAVVILCIVQNIALVISLNEYNKREQNRKVVNILFCIIPVINAFVCAIFGTIAMGKAPSMEILKYVNAAIFGFLFIFIGNYMPKMRQNYTIGMKIKWTLENEENWNATHRFGGKLMFWVGVIILACAFLPFGIFFAIFFISVLGVVFGSILYSYLYYRKQVEQGRYEISPDAPHIDTKNAKKATTVISVIAVVIVCLIMFTGKLTFTLEGESIEIKGSMGGGAKIKYSEIDSIEYREGGVDGVRISGVGSAKLLYGYFSNDEFGTYHRYTYTNSKSAIVILVNGEEYVIADVDTESTKVMYEYILGRIGE